MADGYGESHGHRYDHKGTYLSSINGEEGTAGALTQPHGVCVDHRGSDPELYIADRRNQRVQVYDLDGQFKRAFGTDFLNSPSSFIVHDDLLMIVEYRGPRLTILDADDRHPGR